MNFKTIPKFLNNLKRLAKKYPSIVEDIEFLKENLSDNPFEGESLGRSCYKIRMAISSKNSCKSGGARVITLVKIENDVIHLLTIYDKSEKENISDKELTELINLTEE